MARLFKRAAAVTVGTPRFTALDFSFSVTKSLDREPNTAEIKIWNLSETSRQSAEQAENQRVRLEAGYEIGDGTSVIFEGNLRKASSKREGPDIVTTIEAGDGERAYRGSRVNRSFGPGTSLRAVIEALGDAMGLGTGNLPNVASEVNFEGLGDTFAEGVVISGAAREELSGLLDSAGIEWSVQNGNLQLLVRRRALDATAIRLSSETGLVESPAIDSEGVMTAKALLISEIFPGRKVQIDSEFVTGFYRVTKATYTGDTAGTDWYVNIEGRVAE